MKLLLSIFLLIVIISCNDSGPDDLPSPIPVFKPGDTIIVRGAFDDTIILK